MSAPFYNIIKGTTSGTPGTGSFTPSAASAGFLAWSTVASGWMGMVRYEDGSAWEISYGYWNGTAITRPAGGFVASSTTSQLSLTSSATAALVVDADEIAPSMGTRLAQAVNGDSSLKDIGLGSWNTRGTAASTNIGTTNFLTEQNRVQYTSATTANAAAGIDPGDNQAIYSTAAGRGGFHFSARFGCSQLPTGPRVFIGMSDTVPGGTSVNPGTYAQNFAVLGKDEGDTNLQFITNDGGATAGKTDTGIPLTANGFYKFTTWVQPGGGRAYFRLFRLDTGAIFYAERTTDLPANGTGLKWNVSVGLNGTNTGTAVILHIGTMLLRTAVI